MESSDEVRERVASIYRTESRRVLATLIRLLGDFDLAEEAMQEAFSIAVTQWEKEGVPNNPRAWLVSTGRFKAVDRIRRQVRFHDALPALAERLERNEQASSIPMDEDVVEDDQLRLIFTCCHPSLSQEAQIALTLREVCDLTTDEIARAFLSPVATIAQRIVRAKSKIREAGIPYAIPSRDVLSERLDSVLRVIYLVFNEGYAASQGDEVTRASLTTEAIRLGRLLVGLLPEAEVQGLLALMLLHESRREARTTPEGNLILLSDQDRTRWNREWIEEGIQLVQVSLRSKDLGPYTLQAAIAAVHADARTADATDWPQIVALYEVLHSVAPSPIIELNRAVAVAMSGKVSEGLALIESILERGELNNYHLAHSAKADLCRRLGRNEMAIQAYERALALTRLDAEIRFLQGRLTELKALQPPS